MLTMQTETVRKFLKKPPVARMSVIDFDGYPHTVPVVFLLDGDDLVITTVRQTRKVDYIKANPKGSLVVGGDFDDEAGYLLKGEYSLEEDPGHEWIIRTIHYIVVSGSLSRICDTQQACQHQANE